MIISHIFYIGITFGLGILTGWSTYWSYIKIRSFISRKKNNLATEN
ncbi:MAG: hypothetical protein KatS3mg085_187 [Candidatus Dojkabacteria bacterium]|nr:MAG: hypothetical protein KatS3mg085_187 [Candidatus Dojkabacteria bacterium]